MTEYVHYPNAIPCPTNGFAVGAAGSEVSVDVDQFVLQGIITDISTAGSNFIVSPYAGTINTIYTTFDGNITTAATAAITFEIGGTAVSGGTATIGGATAECAAGVVDTATPTGTNTITAGGSIEMITDGGSTCATAGGTTTNPGKITLICQRT